MKQSGVTRAAEIAYIVLILALAGIVWREAQTLPLAPYDALGPKTFPIWVSYGLAALGLAMLLRLVLRGSLGHAAQVMVTGLDEATVRPGQQLLPAALMLILAFAYAAALSFRAIPFLPATAVYLFLAGIALGPLERRRMAIIAGFAIVAAATLDFLFRTIFKLDLT